MGMATVALIYDLVRRRFGRVGGFIAGLTLAITPITVAMSRHNNPDAAVILCCVAALWFAVRALEDGRTKWIVWSGVMVGLGFEAKMGTALLVVPAIAAAWLWASPNTAAQALPPAACGRRGAGGRWRGLAPVGDADARRRPAVDRRYRRQQHLVADHRLQRRGSHLRSVGRAGRGLRRGRLDLRRQLERVPPAQLGSRWSGRLAARLRAGQRHRPGCADTPAPPGSSHRLDDRHRRFVHHLGGCVQRRPGNLPSLLRLLPRALQRRAGRRRRRPDREARYCTPGSLRRLRSRPASRPRSPCCSPRTRSSGSSQS